MTVATPRTSRVPTALFGAASLLLLAAGTLGTAQLLAAERPCDPNEYLCLYPALSEFIFTGGFLVAAGFAAGAALAATAGRLGAAMLGGFSLVPVAIVVILLAPTGDFPMPLWTIAGPGTVVIALLTVIPLRVTLTTAAVLTCAAVVAGIVAVLLTPPPPPIGTQQQISGNLAYLQRRDPRPADAAALAPAERDLDQVLQTLQAQHVVDDGATRQALIVYPTLGQAQVHQPTGDEKLLDTGTTVVVVLEHGSACLIGELGPTSEAVHVVGLTRDGACIARYGH